MNSGDHWLQLLLNNFFFFFLTPKMLKIDPFDVFWAKKFFFSEFDETWYIDAPLDEDHFAT
jgi:hypothetical protein